MRMYPTKILNSLCRFALFLIVLSCSKDSDLIYDAISELEEPATEQVEETTETESTEEESTSTETTTEESSETTTEEPPREEESGIPDGYESRTTSFPPAHDAHIQSGKGFNQQIIRLDEGSRISYVLFDLQPIADINGQITGAQLEFTTQGDEGDGTINIYLGDSANWTETSLNQGSAPDPSTLLGTIVKEYMIGVTEQVELVTETLLPQATSLILDHKDGNDLALASKEHPSTNGPELVVSYYAPIDAPIIDPTQNQQQSEEENQEETTENQAPMAVADATPISGNSPLEVTFSGVNSTDDTGIVSYAWAFGDGATSTAMNPVHTYTELGEYQAVLTVTDGEGLTSSDSVSITVTDEEDTPPEAVAGANPTSGPAPLEVSFTGTNSTDDDAITSYLWDFQDNELSAAPNPTWTFNTPGTYNVTLTVKDTSNQEDTTTITITVTEPDNEAPVANASATPVSGTAPLEVSFSSNGSSDDNGITAYSWNFKDGQSSSAANPTHTFNSPGTYQVTLTVTDEDNLSDTDTVTITVNEASNQAPTAVATASTTSGDAPLTVNFSASGSSDDNGIVNYYWDFSTNDPFSGQNPTRTFDVPGTYLVTLTVTDGGGLTDTDTLTITVNDGGGSGGGGSNGNYPPGAVFASDFGFNSNDATDALRDAITSNATFIVVDKQSSDWVLAPLKLFNIQNKTIVFESGVTVRSKNGAFTGSNDIMFQLVNAINVDIEGYGATLKMNKNEYSGESRHAFGIFGGRDITVKGLTFREAPGDGIYLTGSSGGHAKNVTIEDIVSINNKRQGMSIIDAEDVWVRNSQFKNTSGTQPEAGVDLEPNQPSQRLVNLNFINCTFSGNNFAGFMMALGQMNGSSIPVSVLIKNSTFSNNANSTSHSKPQTELFFGADGIDPVGGNVRFENVNFNGSVGRLIFSKKTADAYNVEFVNCNAYGMVQQVNTAPISLERSGNANTLGGYDFNNFYLEYNRNQPFLRISGPSSLILKNITGNFTIKEPNDNDPDYNNINLSNAVNFDVNYTHVE